MHGMGWDGVHDPSFTAFLGCIPFCAASRIFYVYTTIAEQQHCNISLNHLELDIETLVA